MESSFKLLGQEIKMHVDFEIIKIFIERGFDQDRTLSYLSRFMTDTVGLPIGLSSTSIFSDFIEEGIKERGEDLFAGLEKIKTPLFALVDKSPYIVGHSEGLFYFNRYFFDEVLPNLWLLRFQRAVIKMYITHILLEALGIEQTGIISNGGIAHLMDATDSADTEVVLSILKQTLDGFVSGPLSKNLTNG